MSGGYDRWRDPAEPAWVAEPTTEWRPQFPGQRYPGDIGIEYLTPPAPRGRSVVGRAEVQPASPAPGDPHDDAHPVSPAAGDRRGSHPVSPAPGDRRGSYPVSPAPGDRRGSYPVSPAPGDRRGSYPVVPGGGDRRGTYPVIPGPGARRDAADGRGRDDARATPDGRERPAWSDRRGEVDARDRRPRTDGRVEDGRTGDDFQRRGPAQPADHGPGRYDRRTPEWTVDRDRAAGWHGDRPDQPWGRPESGRRMPPPDAAPHRPVSPAPEPGWLPEPDEFPHRPHPADRRPDAPARSERQWGTPAADARPTTAPRGPADRREQGSDGPPPREREPRREAAARAETYRDASPAPERDGLRRPAADPHRPAHGDPRPVGRPAAFTPDERPDTHRPQGEPRRRPEEWPAAEQRARTEPARYRPDERPRPPAAPNDRPGPDGRAARPVDPAPPGRDERRPAGSHPDGWQRHPAEEAAPRYDGRRPEPAATRPDDRYRPEDRPAFRRPEERPGQPADRGTARPTDGWRPPTEPARRARPDESPSRPVEPPPTRHDDDRRPPVEPAARTRPDDRPVAPTSGAPVPGRPGYPVPPADQPHTHDRSPRPAAPEEPRPTSAPPAAGLRPEYLPGPAPTRRPAGPDADDDRTATHPTAARHGERHSVADAPARPAPPAYPGPAGPRPDERGTRAEAAPPAYRPVSAPPASGPVPPSSAPAQAGGPSAGTPAASTEAAPTSTAPGYPAPAPSERPVPPAAPAPVAPVSGPPAQSLSGPPAQSVSGPPAQSVPAQSTPPAGPPAPPSSGPVRPPLVESTRPVSGPPAQVFGPPVSAPPAPASAPAQRVSGPPAQGGTPAQPVSGPPAHGRTSAQPGSRPADPAAGSARPPSAAPTDSLAEPSARPVSGPPAGPVSGPPAGPVSGPPAGPVSAAPQPEPDTTTETEQPAEQPAPPTDPEQALAAFRWRLDPETLREEATDPEELRVVRDGLTAKLGTVLDNRSRARLLSLRSVASRILGELDDALADGRLAVTYAEATGELRRTALARARLAQVLRWRGEHAEADRLFAEANSPELPDRLRAALHEHAGRSCLDQGRLIEACHHFERALDLRQGADPELIARTGVALDAVRERAAAGGFGPWPRDRDEMLRGERPPAPTFDEELELWGYADAEGNLVIEHRYAEVQPFHEGRAWVRRPEASRWALIDTSGSALIEANNGYRGVGSFSGGLAWVSMDGKGNWMAVDPTNMVKIPPGFEDVRPFRGGLAAVRRGGWGAVDRTGQLVVPTRYHGFPTALPDGRYVDGFTEEGLAVVELAGRRGVVDRTGRVIVEPAYRVLVIHPVAFLVGDGAGRWGALDRNGEPLIDPVQPSRAEVVAEIDRLLADTSPVL
ncbi:WG repeat-containing protein [Micromonospora sp. IBHARD004]|uniref:WG repeat-containing protein n=1 Tax=Micromonospora sp. IBHARD004 TaxID=3457764 RepID=UPI004057FD6E